MKERPVYYLRPLCEKSKHIWLNIVYMTWRERLMQDRVTSSLLDGAVAIKCSGMELGWRKWTWQRKNYTHTGVTPASPWWS